MRHRFVEQRHHDAAVRDAAPALIAEANSVGRDALAVERAIEMHVHADRIVRPARKAVAVVERDVAHRPAFKRSIKCAGRPALAHLRCTCSIG